MGGGTTVASSVSVTTTLSTKGIWEQLSIPSRDRREIVVLREGKSPLWVRGRIAPSLIAGTKIVSLGESGWHDVESVVMSAFKFLDEGGVAEG